MDEILVTKENDNNHVYYESSSDGDVDVELNSRKYRNVSRRNTSSQSNNSPAPVRRAPVPVHRSSVKPPDDMLNMFSNPEKQYTPKQEETFGYDQSPPMSENALSDQPHEEDYGYNEPEYDDDPIQPGDGFNTVEDEKQDLLYKFYRMQTKGIPISKKFNMSSDLLEMRREYTKITRDMEVNGSIKFSRRMLMACVTGIEFMNKRYDPFDVKLDGWSESLMENMDDYDNVFERLHDKYASKVQMAPEIELLLSITGSAFMFHLTNSMVGNLPNLNDIAKSNPDIISNLMKTMSNVQGGAAGVPSNFGQPRQSSSPNTASGPSEKKEMKGPMFDMSSVMGMFNGASTETPRPLPPVIPPPIPPMIPPPMLPSNRPVNNTTFMDPLTEDTTREKANLPVVVHSPSVSVISSSIYSDVSDIPTKTISFSESAITNGSKGRRGRKPKVSADKTITI
jgi:hypothetical protein